MKRKRNRTLLQASEDNLPHKDSTRVATNVYPNIPDLCKFFFVFLMTFLWLQKEVFEEYSLRRKLMKTFESK